MFPGPGHSRLPQWTLSRRHPPPLPRPAPPRPPPPLRLVGLPAPGASLREAWPLTQHPGEARLRRCGCRVSFCDLPVFILRQRGTSGLFSRSSFVIRAVIRTHAPFLWDRVLILPRERHCGVRRGAPLYIPVSSAGLVFPSRRHAFLSWCYSPLCPPRLRPLLSTPPTLTSSRGAWARVPDLTR